MALTSPLHTSFVPSKAELSRLDFLTFELRVSLPQRFFSEHGGYTRNRFGRANEFKCTVERYDGVAVPVFQEDDFGGRIVLKEISVGQEDIHSFYLYDWVDAIHLTEGEYTFIFTGPIRIRPEENWSIKAIEHTVRASTVVRILPMDVNALKAYAAEAAPTMLSEGLNAMVSRHLQQLMQVEEVRELLLDALEKQLSGPRSPEELFIATDYLRECKGSERAFQILRKMAEQGPAQSVTHAALNGMIKLFNIHPPDHNEPISSFWRHPRPQVRLAVLHFAATLPLSHTEADKVINEMANDSDPTLASEAKKYRNTRDAAITLLTYQKDRKLYFSRLPREVHLDIVERAARFVKFETTKKSFLSSLFGT